jgi:hypothetical protein
MQDNFIVDDFLALPNFLMTAKDAEDILALARATRSARVAAKLTAERECHEAWLLLQMRRRYVARLAKDVTALDEKVGKLRGQIRSTGLTFNIAPPMQLDREFEADGVDDSEVSECGMSEECSEMGEADSNQPVSAEL